MRLAEATVEIPSTLPEPHARPRWRRAIGYFATRRSAWSASVFASALLLALWIYRQLWADPFDKTLGRAHHVNDPMQFIWFLGWFPWAVLHGHNPFHTNAIDFPHGVGLSWNPLLPTLGVVASPITLTLGATFTYSLVMTLSPALTTLTGFWWLRRYTRHPAPAAAGGFAIGYCPFIAGHMQGHLHLAFAPLIPLILLLLDDLVFRRPRPQRHTAIWLGVAVAAELGIAEEHVIILIFTIVFAVISWLVVAGREARRKTLVALGTSWRPLLGAAALCTLIASPLLVSQLFLSPHINLKASVWRASIGDYLAPISAQLIRFDTNHLTHLGGGEDGVYLGPAMIAVLLVGTVMSWRKDRRVRASAITIGCLVVLTFGDSLFGITLPWHYLKSWPALGSVLPARFAFGTVLVVAFLLAIWSDALLDKWRARQRYGAMEFASVAGLVAIGCALVSWAPRHIGASELPSTPAWATSNDIGLHYGDPVLILPTAYPRDSTAMYFQEKSDFRFSMPGAYAIRPTPGAYRSTYWPWITPLVTATLDSERPTEQDFEAARKQLATEHYREIVVVDRLPQTAAMLTVGESLARRPPDTHTEGVYIWYLAST